MTIDKNDYWQESVHGIMVTVRKWTEPSSIPKGMQTALFSLEKAWIYPFFPSAIINSREDLAL